MINVRGLANMATQTVNPNMTVTLEVNTGFTVDDYGNQIPSFIAEQIEVRAALACSARLEQGRSP